jgi:GH24 family phage-related lysozyme (muramidase)
MTLKQAVIDAFAPSTTPLEGRVHWPYLDVKGLVTVGVGNLIDPLSLALRLPWVTTAGYPATKEQIESDWRALKAQPALSKQHYRYASAITRIRLTDEAIDDLVKMQLEKNAADVAQNLPSFESAPADVQLAVMSMAWAAGSRFWAKFPKFTAAFKAGDWLGCAAECRLREEGNPGVVPRNKFNRALFYSAAKGNDPDKVNVPPWPELSQNEALWLTPPESQLNTQTPKSKRAKSATR